MHDFLFDEFDPVSSKQWKQKIQFDLKGVDYNDSLVWESNEGIKVKPFYHKDDTRYLTISSQKKHYSICQTIFISDVITVNFLAKDAINRGANAIEFEANTEFEIEELLKGLAIADTKNSLQIHFKLHFLSQNFCSELLQKTSAFNVFLNIDIIGNLAKTGNWFFNNKEDQKILENLLKNATKNTSVLSVDTNLYQNAGANSVQQVAYALAHGNEYLNVIASETKQSVQFNFAVSGNYFFEIAKLRAFQYLWELLIEEHGTKLKANLFVKPSLRNKTLYDYNVNMLRTTTECMSAILGGADVISNVSYDTIYHKKNEFGERIARNQLLILQEESYFKEANQFADGSYYIETLTQQIAEKALTLFKNIEKNGGFLNQLHAGTIQRKLAESAAKEQEQFDNGNIVLLGTNRHPNLANKMKSEIELYPFVKTKSRKTLIKPIISKRLAEKSEKERLYKEM